MVIEVSSALRSKFDSGPRTEYQAGENERPKRLAQANRRQGR